MSVKELYGESPLAPVPLLDVHAHFLTPHTNRNDWVRCNSSRIAAGRKMGIACHVASVLGSWGHTSPTYFASPPDQTRGNDWLYDFADSLEGEVRAYVAVNPNFTAHALAEMERGHKRGAVGLKLAAARRADDVLLDELIHSAREKNFPVLHHVWQNRQRIWPNQDASNPIELSRLAARHEDVTFILAHIGGGGDWSHTSAVISGVPNIMVDLSGSGIDRGMLDHVLEWLGPQQLLWASDVTLGTALSKLRALEHTGATADDIADICWRNAVRIFPGNTFQTVKAGDLQT